MKKRTKKTTATRTISREPEPIASACTSTTTHERSQPATPGTDESASTPVTKVAARVDVGYGNSLYIRGQGAGLSWDRGLPLQCEGADSWVWSIAQSNGKHITFKLLLNDQVWAQGDDTVAVPGRTLEVAPVF